MAIEEKFLEAIKKLREPSDKKRNFNQSVDLIINLKEFDVRKSAFSVFVSLPFKIKDKKILGFFEKKSKVIDTLLKDEFIRYKEKKDSKKLVKHYDFFISNAKLMPSVATSFGRILGPTGKMPSPQLGVLTNEDESVVSDMVKKINSTVRVRVKEPSIKVLVAKESLKDNEILENLMAVYNKILENLPKKAENIRNIKIKLTMGAPITVEI